MPLKLPIEWYPGPTGQKVVIRDMTDTHLQNAIRFFRRKLDEWTTLERDGYRFADATGGEVAAMELEAEADRAGDQALVTTYLLEALHNERKRRRLPNPETERKD